MPPSLLRPALCGHGCCPQHPRMRGVVWTTLVLGARTTRTCAASVSPEAYVGPAMQQVDIVCSYQRATDLTRHYSSAGPPAEWGGSIPNTGTLTFDYLSHKEPPKDIKVATFNQLTAALEACGVVFARGGGRAVLPTGAGPVFCNWKLNCSHAELEYEGQHRVQENGSMRRCHSLSTACLNSGCLQYNS